MNKSEPIKIIYSEKDNQFKVASGIVNLGYMGTYNTKNIEVDFEKDTMEYIFNSEDEDDYYLETFAPLKPYLRPDMTNDEIAKGLTDFYNARITDINKHQVELNQVFLINLLEDDCGSAFPFWEECSDYIIENKMPDCDEDYIEDEIYNEDAVNIVDDLFDEIEEKCCNGEVDNSTPVEDVYRKYFPMFDIDKFLSDIYGEYLNLNNANVIFQCSGKGQALEIACGAYAQITINNSFYDWHNH